MKVIPETDLCRSFIEGLQEAFEGERPNIHVTDLIYCLREAYFRRVSPKPLTEDQLSFFLDGSRRHEALQYLSGVECEKPVRGLGIVGTVDIFGNVPIEFKTTRGSGIPKHYLKQLGYYCVLSGSQSGILVIQRLNNRDNPPFEFYRIEYTRDELLEMAGEIVHRRTILEKALKEGSPEGLPKSEESWKCSRCLWRDEC